MSIFETFMSPHPNGLHMALLLIGLVAGGIAVHLDIKHRRTEPEQIAPLRADDHRSHFNFKPCSCPSGDCPAWERKAGLDPINPDCPIHGEEVKAA